MDVIDQQFASPSTRAEENPPSDDAPLPPRCIGRLGSSADGPTLICLGSIHGNEPAGFLGLRRVVGKLEENGTSLSGEFVALLGNRQAGVEGVRFVDEDLNRSWYADRLAELAAGQAPASVEELEMVELKGEIDAAIERAQGDVWLLDLHTTSGLGPPFGVLDDTLGNREFADLFGIPFVVGLEEELDGTVLSHYVPKGLRTFGLESGQHEEIDAVARAESAIWIALEGVGLIGSEDVPDIDLMRSRLRSGTEGLPRVVEVRYRHAIEPGDRFRMEPGFESFQLVTSGELLSHDAAGEVRARESGLLLMPLYQEQGSDGFFMVHSISRFWMWLSAGLRHLRAERFLHWFPGVRRAPDSIDTFIVNRRVARWFALELLHLLGFRRHGRSGHYLLVSRRPNDSADA